MFATLTRFVIAACLLAMLNQSAAAQTPPLRWWKGNLHTHTLWSDGNDFPEMVANWYVEHDYNFLTLTDHNILSEGQKWMKADAIAKRSGGVALEKYLKKYGDQWVETRGKPGTPGHEVRLKPLDEFRTLVESRQNFLMIPSEEISDRSQGKPVHMNAANLRNLLAPVGGKTVRETIANNLRAVREQEQRVGRPIMLHLNHPNFGLAVTAEDLVAVLEQRFFEVYNGHPGVLHLGDANHPSVERLWDISSTLRIDSFKTAPMFGLATDDSHHYHGKGGSRLGRGWVQVRSRYLTPEHLIGAMRGGDFYFSSGVELKDVAFEAKAGVLEIDIKAEPGVKYTTQFIGTLEGYDKTAAPRKDKQGKAVKGSLKYSADIGKVLSTQTGPQARFQLTGKEIFVRAVVTSSRAHVDPSFKGQMQQAWTQPVGWRKRVK